MGVLSSLNRERKRATSSVAKEAKRRVSDATTIIQDGPVSVRAAKALKDAMETPDQEASAAEEALAPVDVSETTKESQRKLRRRRGISSTLLATSGQEGGVRRPSLLS